MRSDRRARSANKLARIDWALEGQQATAAITFTPNVRGFGASANGEFARTDAQPLSAHVPGKQYRTTHGAWVVWVGARCYLVSKAPPWEQPEILARPRPTRTVCQGDAESQAEVFKDPPAYGKRHPR